MTEVVLVANMVKFGGGSLRRRRLSDYVMSVVIDLSAVVQDRKQIIKEFILDIIMLLLID